MARIEPSRTPAGADDKPVSARDAALRSTLEAMHSAPSRFRPFVRRLVEAELRLIRRRERASRPAPAGEPAADSGAEPPPASSLSEIPVRSPAAAGPAAMTIPPKFARTRPAPQRPPVRSMTNEERWSLAGWTGAALLVLASFVSGYPGRAPRPLPGPQVCVTLPIDPARLNVTQLARQPLTEIVALANHDDPQVRGRMLSALVRRQETGALVALARGPRAAVRQAVPAALAALGRLDANRASELSSELVAADPRARERAAAVLASLEERVGLAPAATRQ